MVKNNTLLLIAGLVWIAAGVNILRIGIACYGQAVMGIVQHILMLLIFGVFGMMFLRIVKNTPDASWATLRKSVLSGTFLTAPLTS